MADSRLANLQQQPFSEAKSNHDKPSLFEGDTLSKAADSLLIMDHKLPAIESLESLESNHDHSKEIQRIFR